jgi:hypothetical protein
LVLGSKKQRLLLGANANLIELNQFIQDASKLTMENSVKNLVARKHALEAYTKKYLSLGNFLKRLVFLSMLETFLFQKN